jgi:hypothetical protein
VFILTACGEFYGYDETTLEQTGERRKMEKEQQTPRPHPSQDSIREAFQRFRSGVREAADDHPVDPAHQRPDTVTPEVTELPAAVVDGELRPPIGVGSVIKVKRLAVFGNMGKMLVEQPPPEQPPQL